MNHGCIYCEKELLFPWEKRRMVCDSCHYAISDTYHEDYREIGERKIEQKSRQS
ncbi:hypothetical protein [Bacillus sp. RAR_GA_16]|uniref:hypothetical protein n=1 Tax=Bacillus sp. RAR_GA_16 TaxID=2876774 RepID=UPI001CCB1BB8|nr:hypothetical protein [Bacillus sp. RAR_GA_16]